MQEIKTLAEASLLKFYRMVEERLGYTGKIPSLNFNKKGVVGGTANPQTNTISLNRILMEENTDEYVNQIIPHELAHIVADNLYGTEYTRTGRRRSHGPRWKSVMRVMGLVPDRCHNMDVSRSQVKKQREWGYTCGCVDRVIMLSTTRHNRIRKGKGYRCNRCKCQLVKA